MKPNDLDIWWAELNVADRVEASVRKLTTRLSTSVENLLNSCLHVAVIYHKTWQPDNVATINSETSEKYVTQAKFVLYKISD